MTDQREAFEAFIQARRVSAERYKYPQYEGDPLPYKDPAVEFAWQAWQAAIAYSLANP